MPSIYWNPKTETLSREELDGLRLVKLRILCEWAAAKSPFYKNAFSRAHFDVGQLSNLEDIQRIPFLTRAEWMTSQAAAPPFGTIPTADPRSLCA